MTNINERPNPLKDAASKAGAAWAALAGVVGLAAGYGVITSAQADAIATVGRELPGWIEAVGPIAGGVLAAGGVLLGAFRTAAAARANATPSDDPRDRDGMVLVRDDTGLTPAAHASMVNG